MSANLPSATSIKEAAERQIEYDPAVRASYVRKMVKDISQMIAEGETEQTIRSKVPDFVEQYPELFKKMIKKEDITIMYDMLKLLDKMGEGKLSQHAASVAVGQSLVNRFVTPQLKGKQ